LPDAALDRFRFPLFPIVGKGRSLLQPIHANDVAKAVLLALERPLAIGKSYDIVGPQRMTLRQVVQVVAEGMAVKLWIVSTPIWIHRLAVHGMNALLSNPLATPSQLQMLSDGLYGDLEPARQDLGLEPLAYRPSRRTPSALSRQPFLPSSGLPYSLGERRQRLYSNSLPRRWNRSAQKTIEDRFLSRGKRAESSKSFSLCF